MKPTPTWIIVLTVCIAICVGQWIGIQRIEFGIARVILLPLVFAFIAGLLMNPAVVPPLRRIMREGAGQRASRIVGAAVMPVIVVLTASIGTNIDELVETGPALIAQEFGNLGTMLLAMPAAVLAFKMGRESIGATFSIAREGGLAFIFDKYGPNTPEATGVTAVYICGTFFGTALFTIMPPFVASLEIFDIRALAMACGTGSASMTGACATALSEEVPAQTELIGALAAGSNLMSGVSNLFIIIFITVPLAEVYYRSLAKIRSPQAEVSDV
ncbi:MAG: DUF3100 domain-containing protein [Pseudomonadota bacterium]